MSASLSETTGRTAENGENNMRDKGRLADDARTYRIKGYPAGKHCGRPALLHAKLFQGYGFTRPCSHAAADTTNAYPCAAPVGEDGPALVGQARRIARDCCQRDVRRLRRT